MNSLYINVDPPELVLNSKLIKSFELLSFNLEGNQLTILFDPEEWDEPPVFRCGKHILVISGWFILGGRRNDIKALFEEIQRIGLGRALNLISIGVFVGVFFDGKKLVVFNDFLSLSHHFWCFKKALFQLSPFVASFEEEEVAGAQKVFYNEYGYFLGNDTLLVGVERLAPGSIYCVKTGRRNSYFEFLNDNIVDIEKIPLVIRALLDSWEHSKRAIALSSGFDSRLIYTQGRFKSVYTWGPKNSIDRLAAKKLFELKGDLESCLNQFDFNQPDVPAELLELNSILFQGVQKKMNESFIGGYSFSRKLSNGASVAFDGFLGDVLQRGSYQQYKGLRGEVFALFPFLYRFFPPSPQRLIKSRYSKCYNYALNMFNLFLSEYNLKCDVRSYVLFEVFYGRGTRYIVNGGVVLNGIFYTSVPVFMHRVIFETLIEQPFYSVVSRKVFKRLWKLVPNKYRIVNSEHFYSVNSPRWLIPFIALVGRAATHLIPYYYNYGKEHKLKKGK